MLPQIIDILRFMTIGCLILIIIQLLRSNASKHHVVPAAVFSFCVLGYLLVDWELMSSQIAFFLFLIPALALPFIFWICSQSLFDDDFRLQPWMIWGGVVIVLLQFFLHFINNSNSFGLSESITSVVRMAPQSLSLIFIVLGIASAARNREADLVAARFQFRTVFILLTAVLILLTLLTEIAFPNDDAPLWLEFLQKLVIAGLTFYFAIRRLELKPGFFLEAEKEIIPVSPSPVDEQLITQLTDLMENQKIWRTEGLTIRKLAEKMEVKEYRLRQAINKQLGFRNFNDFLNSYRINEACLLLADPAKKEFTILEIAYEMGYQSLSPFNKSFKETTGMTPTEWRRMKAS